MDVVVDIFYLIYSSDNIYSSICYVHTLSWNSTRSGVAAAFIGIFGVVLIFGA